MAVVSLCFERIRIGLIPVYLLLVINKRGKKSGRYGPNVLGYTCAKRDIYTYMGGLKSKKSE